MLKVIERDVETTIDYQLKNLNWKDLRTDPERNVFKQQAKTEEQNKKLGSLKPDYVLYKSNSNQPLIVIEAKRPGENINNAIIQGKKYADIIEAPIVIATDGVFTKTLYKDEMKPLIINNEEVDELIREITALKFLNEGSYEVSTLDKKVIQSRSELINIFKQSNDYLRSEGLTAGVERFSEFSNILFLKLISELEDIKDELNSVYEQSIIEREYRWNFFKNKKGIELLDYVNNIVLKKFQDKYDKTIFQPLLIKNPYTLERIVGRLDDLQLTDINSDVKGDAFEYFLRSYNSGSKDLGEYFTPRHVIKTMVKLLSPRLGETVYDPFCGTGGMLIESFKHIRNSIPQNIKAINLLRKDTIFGNEITNTARITKMNMILMGDGHSNIQRRDSLANPVESKHDIVITNIPFAQTTEYGHLYDVPTNQGNSICVQHALKALKNTENSRAALVVPDGFLYDRKYMKTRKFIMDRHQLKSVISLPAGTFKPYTDVKTSILLFKGSKNQDKKIWHFAVKNDGYTFNSKREKKIGVNDLDILISERNNNNVDEKIEFGFNLLDLKDVKSNDYRLLINDYISYKIESNHRIESLGNLIFEKKEKVKSLDMDIWTVSNTEGFVKQEEVFSERVASKNISNYKIVGESEFAYNPSRINVGSIALNESNNLGCVSPMYVVFACDNKKLYPAYLKHILKHEKLKKIILEKAYGSVRDTLKFSDLCEIEIPLPSIQEQKMIVSEINNCAQIIDASVSIVKNYKPFLEIKPDWEIYKLDEICDFEYGYTDTSNTDGNVRYIRITDIDFDGTLKKEESKYIRSNNKNEKFKLTQNDLLVARIGATYGKTLLFDSNEAAVFASYLIRLKLNKKVLPKYYFYFSLSDYYWEQVRLLVTGGAQPQLNANRLSLLKIPVPTLKEQQKIIDQIDKERHLVEASKEIIEIFTQKIHGKINRLFES
ncbi:N-6 DNA methylase [Sebaldella sp. S0638]|uniref:N-6 DNA methylase n=1 Tax=Sebaldella sp. S0638 TaxID=2957809 RepID=UPI00209F3954|nr:N-6 DNA methylase [Sebaldella sp. S0638]MCP1224851.1 N-6 DNA methylase [Sebaldella sp. S0638]